MTAPDTQDHLTTADGLKLHVQRWLPDGPARAAFVLVHGLTEHSGRYAELAGRLTGLGYAVYAADLRGHGHSEGEPILVMQFDQYLDDVELLLGRVRGWEPDRPLFLFGHSMGGTIVALLAATRNPDARGVVLSAPAVVIGQNIYPLLRKLARFFGKLLPRLRVARLGSSWISRDEAVIEDFQDDPLVYHGRLPTRTGAELLQAVERVRRTAEAIRLPLLVLHGTGDRLTDPAGSRQLYDRARSPDKSLKLYDGLYHDLVHEPEKEEVMADLVGWLEGRMKDEG